MTPLFNKQAAIVFSLLAATSLFLGSCKEDDPKKEDVPELITKVVLTFNTTDASPIVVTATDPDGDGVQPVTIDEDIVLNANTTYTLGIQLLNTLAEPTDEAYHVTTEVEEEGDEHMFFFGWTNNVFSNPEGNGNIDNRGDAMIYDGAANSIDANGLPLGLTTTWTTASNGEGTFRIMLKHQPDLKTESSGATVGETDLDVTFNILIND